MAELNLSVVALIFVVDLFDLKDERHFVVIIDYYVSLSWYKSLIFSQNGNVNNSVTKSK